MKFTVETVKRKEPAGVKNLADFYLVCGTAYYYRRAACLDTVRCQKAG